MLIEAQALTVYGLPGKARRFCAGWLKRCFGATGEQAPLLKQVSCDFSCGINVILGPNGAGKSILLQVLDGQIQPDSGRIRIDGQVAKPGVLRKNIGYLPQTFGFYPKLTAREMLDYIALLKGIVHRQTRENEVKNVLQRTELLAVAGRKVGTYSRGMRQRVGIAQALLGNPPILILDEPTAGLDPEFKNNIRGMLAEFGQEKVIIWASSLIADTYCADRVLVLESGVSKFWGTPVQLGACARLQNVDDGKTGENYSAGKLEQGYRTILGRT